MEAARTLKNSQELSYARHPLSKTHYTGDSHESQLVKHMRARCSYQNTLHWRLTRELSCEPVSETHEPVSETHESQLIPI